MNAKRFLPVLIAGVLVVAASLAFADQTMKGHHKENSLSCDDCHVTDVPEAVPMEQCLACHELPEAKEDYHGAPDHHDSPHYGPELECENCHMEHEPSVNFCNDCHEFEFKVP